VVAVFALWAVLLVSCSSPAREAKVTSGGPLIGEAYTQLFQPGATGASPLLFAAALLMSDGDRRPVTILSVGTYGDDHLRLTEAVYAALAQGHGSASFRGQTGAQSVEAQGAVSQPGKWDHTRPLAGARIDPCCKRAYYVGLAYRPDVSSVVGHTSGLIVTYRVSTGRVYRVAVPVVVSFCTQAAGTPACDRESARAQREFTAGYHVSAVLQLFQAGWWHG